MNRGLWIQHCTSLHFWENSSKFLICMCWIIREIPRVKPSMEEAGAGVGVAGVTGLLWLCGFLACWFVTVMKNHIARDYHTATALPAVPRLWGNGENGGNLTKRASNMTNAMGTSKGVFIVMNSKTAAFLMCFWVGAELGWWWTCMDCFCSQWLSSSLGKKISIQCFPVERTMWHTLLLFMLNSGCIYWFCIIH